MIRAIVRNPFRLAVFCLALVISCLAIAAEPEKAKADICTINGRDCYYGYFYGGHDGGPGVLRWNVISAPAYLNVNNNIDLINWTGAYLAGCSNLNSQNQTGAAFIILTMLGAPPGTNKADACARFGEWASLVNAYWDAGLMNPNIVHNFGGINTRSTLTDVAYYPMNGAAPSIVFYSPINGAPIYAIKRDCANPVGVVQGLPRNFNLQPDIVVEVNGSVSTIAEAGDTLRFSYRIVNTANMASIPVNCDAHSINHPGYFPTPGTPEGGGGNVPLSGCPASFPRFSTTEVGVETVTATANTTVCRTLFVDPSTPGGGRVGYEECVHVTTKPYLKVFGGDVSAGGGFETAPSVCANSPSRIVSWNKRDAAYSGASTQFGAMSLSTITDFATSFGGVGAAAPVSLSFANTATNPPAGNFGGNYGSVKCIRDYFGQRPTSGLLPIASIGSGGPGNFTYGATGATTLGGLSLSADRRYVVYIDGDLQINGNINYLGSWGLANMPMLLVVVRGNIFIANGVTNLNGTFVAQPTAAGTKGVIYTCASGFTIPTVNDGSFAGGCTNKLTVNGSFVAKEIEFLRVRGTLRNSAPGEGSGSANIAEEFNYGPAFWITQPHSSSMSSGRADNYESITSLPPIL